MKTSVKKISKQKLSPFWNITINQCQWLPSEFEFVANQESYNFCCATCLLEREFWPGASLQACLDEKLCTGDSWGIHKEPWLWHVQRRSQKHCSSSDTFLLLLWPQLIAFHQLVMHTWQFTCVHRCVCVSGHCGLRVQYWWFQWNLHPASSCWNLSQSFFCVHHINQMETVTNQTAATTGK